MQLSLWDQFEPGQHRGLSELRRTDLGEGAWVDFAPDWLHGSVALFELLLRTATWELHRREMYDRIVEVPRLVAGMPGTDVEGLRALRIAATAASRPKLGRAETTWTRAQGQARPVFAEVEARAIVSTASQAEIYRARDLLSGLATALSNNYRRKLSQVSLGYYRDGRDSVAYHGDKLGPLRKDTVVAIASVGARRRFLLRKKSTASGLQPQALVFEVGEGDLLVMGGSCQETWEHAIPKVQSARPRIAIMFREPVPVPARVGPTGAQESLPAHVVRPHTASLARRLDAPRTPGWPAVSGL